MARLFVIAVGRLKRASEQALVEDYLKRARPLLKRLGFAGIELREIAESRADTPALRKRQEADAIGKAGPKNAVLIALDERGDDITSRQFAERLRQQAATGRDVAIIIGGPDGLAEELKAQAAWQVRFGRLTWPHRLARVMLAEQLYRAGSIAAGLPYHRD